jgi:hypothetical protein
VELPVQFAPRPPQDVQEVPNHKPVATQRSDWQIGVAQPQAAPAAAQPQPAAAQPQPAGAQPQPAQVHPQPQPLSGQPQPAVAEPPRRKGVWQRFLSWWRGY